MAELSPLRRRMIEDKTVRNFSPPTQRSYIHAVLKFSRHYDRSPDRLTLEDVRNWQVHLISRGISWASLNQSVAALRFFYGVTLTQPEIPERIAYARKPRKLPVRRRITSVAGTCGTVASVDLSQNTAAITAKPAEPHSIPAGQVMANPLAQRQ